MREILFRGKRIDNGAWETGGITAYKQTIRKSGYEIIDKASGVHIPVIPETVGQYTGLKDKNGKMIFEGDIVVNKCGRETFLCAWFDKWCRFILKTSPDRQGWINDFPESIEVIGNIQDNPELLKPDFATGDTEGGRE